MGMKGRKPMKAIEEIKRQQSGKENSTAWMIGMQLIDMIKAEPAISQIVEEDLQNPDMSLTKCADAMRKHADEIHSKSKGNCVCITPAEAEKVIRKFYGLPDQTERPEPEAEPVQAMEESILNLEDFL